MNERPCYLFTPSPSIPMSFTPSPSTAESMRNSDQIPGYVLHTSSFCEHVCVYRWTADTRQTKADGWLQHFLNADKQLFVTGSCSSCLQLVMLVEVLVIILWLLPVFFCPGWQLGTVAPGWTLQQFNPTLNISGKYGGTVRPLTLTHVVPHNGSILCYNIFYAVQPIL